MEIVAIAPEHMESLSQLFVSVFANPPWNELWEYRWAYERLNWVYQNRYFWGLVMMNDKRPVGAIMGRFVPFMGRKGFEIVEFFVDTEYQSHGIGSQLLLELETKLEEKECNFLFLLTAKESAVESFYTKRHYQRDDKLVVLRKELD